MLTCQPRPALINRHMATQVPKQAAPQGSRLQAHACCSQPRLAKPPLCCQLWHSQQQPGNQLLTLQRPVTPPSKLCRGGRPPVMQAASASPCCQGRDGLASSSAACRPSGRPASINQLSPKHAVVRVAAGDSDLGSCCSPTTSWDSALKMNCKGAACQMQVGHMDTSTSDHACPRSSGTRLK